MKCMYLKKGWAGCDTRSIFKQNKAGLGLEFSFPKNGCPTEDNEPKLPYYKPISWYSKLVGSAHSMTMQ